MKILIFLTLLPLFAHASEASTGCLSAQKAQRVLERFTVALDSPTDLCDPNNHGYQVVEALIFMHDLRFDGPGVPTPYNQEILGYDWERRMMTITPIMKWGTRQNCVNAMAYTLPYSENRYHMYWCPTEFSKLNFEDSHLSRIDTMLHESRHMDAINRGGFPHVDCHKQRQGCDRSVQYRGAFAAGMEAMAKIGVSATNVHPALAFSARKMAYYTAAHRFVIPAEPESLQNQSIVLLQEKNSGRRIAFNYRFTENVLNYVPSGRLFEVGDLDMWLAPNDRSEAGRGVQSFALERELNADEDDTDYTRFYTVRLYNKASPAERETLKDSAVSKTPGGWVEFSIWGDRIKIGIKERATEVVTTSELSLPNGKPVAFRSSQEDDEDEIDVLNDQDQLFRLICDDRTHDCAAREIANKYPGFIKISRVYLREAREAWDKRRERRDFRVDPKDPRPEPQKITYLLSKDGQVFQDSPSGPVPVPSLSNRRFDWMSGEILYSPEIPDDLKL